MNREEDNIKLLTVLLPLLLLTGCLDVNQEIWINPDGSGKLRFDLGLSRKISDLEEDDAGINDLADRFKELGRKLFGDPRLASSPVVEEYSDDDYDRVAIEITVNDWHDLPDINKMIMEKQTDEESGTSVSHTLFLFTLREGADGSTYFRQPAQGAIIDAVQPESGESFLEEMGRTIAGAFLEEGEITVTLHSPTISRTNGSWQPDRTSVQWKVNLKDLIDKEVGVDAFTAEIGVSVGSIHFWRKAGILLTVAFLVGLLLRFRKKRRQLPPADRSVT